MARTACCSASCSCRTASRYPCSAARATRTSYSSPRPMRTRSRASVAIFRAAATMSWEMARWRRASMARNQLLATSAAIDWRAYSASFAAASYCAEPASAWDRTRPQRSSSQLTKNPAVWKALPESEPLNAARAHRVHLGIERRPGLPGVGCRPLHARRGDAQIEVVGERLIHQRCQFLVRERGEPIVADGTSRRTRRKPGLGNLHGRHGVGAKRLRIRGLVQRAPTERKRHYQRRCAQTGRAAMVAKRAHQCILRMR